jgi:1,4-dihydroxy-2-naphthoate octaprenyltransferase
MSIGRRIDTLRNYTAELRAPFLTASVLPVLVGSGLAATRGGSGVRDVVLMTLGAALIHSGANVANDYFDAVSGCDAANRSFIRPFTGGSRIVQSGRLTLAEVAMFSGALFAAGGCIGILFAFVSGLWVLGAGAVALFLGYAYTAPPFRLAGRGLGEFTVAVAFGILPVTASFRMLAGRFDADALVLSLPVSLLIAAVIIANEFPDRDADAACGKRTLVVRSERPAAWIHAVCLISWPLPICALARQGKVPAEILFSLLLYPFGLASAAILVLGRRRAGFRTVSSLTLLTHTGAAGIMALCLWLKRGTP